MLQRSNQTNLLSMFALPKYLKLGEKDGYFLYHDVVRNKLYLSDNANDQKLTNILATANYSETREAEIALLSNIQVHNVKDKDIVFDLVKKHLAQNRADLFYSETDMDLSAARGTEKCLHENYVMVRPPLEQTKKAHFLPKGFTVIDDKNQLLSMLPQVTDYLLKHSNWAKINGQGWLTPELLAKRIMESSKTCLLLGPNNECLGYVSFISNGAACYVYNFCIHMEYRGKGLGKLMIDELFPTDQMLYLISAYEGPTMKQAKHLYEKFGFQTYESNPDLRKKVTVLNVEQEKPVPKSKL